MRQVAESSAHYQCAIVCEDQGIRVCAAQYRMLEDFAAIGNGPAGRALQVLGLLTQAQPGAAVLRR